MKALATLFVTLGLTACVTAPGLVATPTPAQSVYLLEGAYASALRAAVAYRNLPRCSRGVVVCHDPLVVEKLVAADNRAHDAVVSAEALVRANGSTERMLAAINAAEVVLADFSAMVPAR